MSDLRVSVRWKNSTVFAGEEIECIITFKNVSQAPRSPSPGLQLRRHDPSRERWKEALPLRPTQGLASSSHIKTPLMPGIPHLNTKVHKPALSISTHNGIAPIPALNEPEGVSKVSGSKKKKHGSSVSIVSLSGDPVNGAQTLGSVMNAARPIRGHVRAASLQLLPRSMVDSANGSQSGRSSLP